MTITIQAATAIALENGVSLDEVEALAKIATTEAHARQIAHQFVNNSPAAIRERQFAAKQAQLRALTAAANGATGGIDPATQAAIMGSEAPPVVDHAQAAADLVAAVEADRERTAAVQQAIEAGQHRRVDGQSIAPTRGVSEVTTKRARRGHR